MEALHTSDANFINIFGTWKQHPDGVREALGHAHGPNGPLAKSTMKIYEQRVSFLTPTIAIVHNNMELLDAPSDSSGLCHSNRVVVKQDGKWMIRDFQNTKIGHSDQAGKPK